MTKQILLTQGKYTLVDDDVFEYLNQFKWFASKGGQTFYAARNIGRPQKRELIHRVITGAPNSMWVDHIDGNGLNNQKSNLRLATSSQNAKNRRKGIDNKSGYKGVSWQVRDKKWQAYITVSGERIHLGYFGNPVEAAYAYDQAAIKYHGEFASLNFQKFAKLPI